MRKRHQFALLTVALLSATAFTFGGWAIVSVDDMPEHFVVGKPTELSFVVRRHGTHPMIDTRPTVTLNSGSSTANAAVRLSTQPGRFVATLVPPRAGDWSVRIQSGFGPAETSMLPTKAIAAGASAPALTEVERGHRLFSAKGCVSCHVVGSEGIAGYKMGPELTGRTFPAEALARFLKNPAANPITRVAEQRMPQMELKDREIASLVAYINSAKQLSSKN